MPASVSWPGRARRTLAGQAESLRRSLESLGQQLRESIAGEVARAVAAVVCAAVRAALDCRPVDSYRRDHVLPGRTSTVWDRHREDERGHRADEPRR